MKHVCAILIIILTMVSSALAHEVRPAYLEMRESATETYEVLWKVPGRGENLRLALYVELPGNCVNLSDPRAVMVNSAFAERWTVRCDGGIAGETIQIAGLSSTATDVLVRIERLGGAMQVTRLMPSSPAFVVESVPNVWTVSRTYTLLGIEHILSGIDHLLFVLALIIITYGGWNLVKTVTAFTVSHSITLSLATLGYVHIPQQPVEAIIALSIVFVASEIVHARKGRPGLTERSPWIVAFIFGLVHGLGFAGGLSEAGLPTSHIPTALLFFSLGVEIGHFLFIALVLSVVAVGRRLPIPMPRWAYLVPPYAIGSMAMFWVIQRVILF